MKSAHRAAAAAMAPAAASRQTTFLALGIVNEALVLVRDGWTDDRN